MDETSFFDSLHQLKLQLDLMNSRTSTMLNAQHNPSITSLPMPPSMPPKLPTLDPPGGGGGGMIPLPSQFQQLHDRFDNLTDKIEWGFDQVQTSLDEISDRLDNFDPPQLTPPESTTSNDHTDPPINQQSAFQTAEIESGLRKPLATIQDLGWYFDPHAEPIDGIVITNASTFSGKLRRLSHTREIPNVEYFLRGSALRWYYIGLREDGTHIYDNADGTLNLKKFCHSLVMLFDSPFSVDEWLADHNTDVKVKWERSEILEDYTFPLLELSREERFDKSTVFRLLCRVVDVYQEKTLLPITELKLSAKAGLGHNLVILRQMEHAAKRRIALNKNKLACVEQDRKEHYKLSHNNETASAESGRLERRDTAPQDNNPASNLVSLEDHDEGSQSKGPPRDQLQDEGLKISERFKPSKQMTKALHTDNKEVKPPVDLKTKPLMKSDMNCAAGAGRRRPSRLNPMRQQWTTPQETHSLQTQDSGGPVQVTTPTFGNGVSWHHPVPMPLDRQIYMSPSSQKMWNEQAHGNHNQVLPLANEHPILPTFHPLPFFDPDANGIRSMPEQKG